MKIAIAGFGMEGKSNFQYFKNKGDVTIVDERLEVPDVPYGTPTILGPDAFSKLDEFDVVVRTAGLAPRKLATKAKIWSATNEFFDKCTVPIIGVTGTKGKGTVSSLIESILKAAGLKTMLVGNIGLPALDALEQANQSDVVVYEMSSFQLWDIEKSPQVAVVLLIEPDHLDVHTSFDEYVNAKANIRRFQKDGDVCFYHPTNEFSATIANATKNGNAYKFNDPDEPRSVYVKDGAFYIENRRICSTDAVQLPGAHNIENACAAISAALEMTDNFDAVERGLRAFTGLPHRLKFVREVNGVRYFDDSIATTPGSVIAAMKAFAGPKVLILGGSSKGANFNELAQFAVTQDIRHVVAIGTEGPVIAAAFSAVNIPVTNLGIDVRMMTIVRTAASVAPVGSTVILSPACASFDMFKSYADRGDQFIAAVNELG